MEIVIKKITPAAIESNIEELDKYIIEIPVILRKMKF